MRGFSIGLTLGIAFGIVIVSYSLRAHKDYSEALDNCAKTNNVYQCEMVALPKTGEVK